MKAPTPKRRAEELVRLDVDPDDGAAVLVGPRQIGDRVAGLALAEEDAAYLRSVLAREFRRLRRAALRTAARRIRERSLGCVYANCYEARACADLVEAMAAPKRGAKQ